MHVSSKAQSRSITSKGGSVYSRMAWQQLSIDLEGCDPATIENAVSELGALSVSFTDAGDTPILEPAPGATPLWPRARLTALFDEQTDPAAVNAALRALGIAANWSTLEDRIWERVWMDDFEPMQFGPSLWVCPHGQQAPADATVVYLDPGLAFGTGRHTTTALCLEWLEQARLEACRVIDYGCGSGILAIAAAKLGAAQVTAVDIDGQALDATRDNAIANGVGDRVTAALPAEAPATPADVVIANILARPLIELAAALAAMTRPGGHIVLSGILDEQAEQVRTAYSAWFEIERPHLRAGWARLTGVRHVHPVS